MNFQRFLDRHPHDHTAFWARPRLSRRHFFSLLGAGLTGSFVSPGARAQEIRRGGAPTQNKAKNLIFILLRGALSQTDTFDFRMTSRVTPGNFNPSTVNGILWPTGLLPKTAQVLPDLTIVRSVKAWALVHSIAQHWTQIGRNPVAALGAVAPNLGSIVAIERADPSAIFPPFLSLNATNAIGSGYLPTLYEPLQVIPNERGLADTTNASGEARFEQMYRLMQDLDSPLRIDSAVSTDFEDYGNFYKAAKGLMYQDAVVKAFAYNEADSVRYGGTSFGDACLVAKQVLAVNQGTRHIQINMDGWDMHEDIYGTDDPAGDNLYTLGKQLDAGFSELIRDLKGSGLLNDTLVVMMGEFGRTVGALSPQSGRDHYLNQFAVFAGAGIKAGRTLGATNADGSAISEFGWSRNREIRIEDIQATCLSALGIDWTTVRYDDPFGRGFEYVPFSEQDLYGPINELWG